MGLRYSAAAVAALLGVVFAAPVRAGPRTDALGGCLIRSSSDADRAVLMRWSFLTIAAHPGVQDLTAISETMREEISRAAGRFFSRLLTVDCRRETIAALSSDGPGSIEMAFRTLGETTTAALLNSPAGAAMIDDMARHFDLEAIEALSKQVADAAAPRT